MSNKISKVPSWLPEDWEEQFERWFTAMLATSNEVEKVALFSIKKYLRLEYKEAHLKVKV